MSKITINQLHMALCEANSIMLTYDQMAMLLVLWLPFMRLS